MNRPVSWRQFGAAIALATTFALGACGGGSGSTTPTSSGSGGGSTPSTPAGTAASISLGIAAPNPIRVKSDNSNTTQLTALVLDASSAGVPGATVSFSASSGFLTSSTVVTNASGAAQVQFSAGADPTNRIASVTARTGGLSKTFPVQIYGSTLAGLVNNNASLPTDGTVTARYTITALDAAGTPVFGIPVTFAQTDGGGRVSITPATATTGVDGKVNVVVTGTVPGSATVTAGALGTTTTQTFTVIPGAQASTFAIATVNGAAVPAAHVVAGQLNIGVPIVVSAPNATTVQFATTLGHFGNGSAQQLVNVNGGQASAVLTSAFAGLGSVQAYDPLNPNTSSDSVTVAFTSATPARVLLQAAPTVIAKAVGGTTAVATVVARVLDAQNQPVGNAPVAFSISRATGGGEFLTNVVGLTAATTANGGQLGETTTSLVSGSISSDQLGVQIHANVVGTNIQSSPDAAVVIGGTAGSVSIGQASVISDDSTHTIYFFPMSILVADSNNNPMANATVSLSAWPVAVNDSDACDGSQRTTIVNGQPTKVAAHVWCNEDTNQNLILDPGEDGLRLQYPGCSVNIGPGTTDLQLTPANSDGGTVPASVKTDANGVATFTLTYPKSSALHVYDRIRASTLVQGTETVGQIEFELPGLDADITPTCHLQPSRYVF